MAKRRKINEVITTITACNLEGSMETAIKYLDDLHKECLATHTDIVLSFDYNEYEADFTVFGNRLETDKERDKRLQKVKAENQKKKQTKAAIEKRERETLEKLAKKYSYVPLAE